MCATAPTSRQHRLNLVCWVAMRTGSKMKIGVNTLFPMHIPVVGLRGCGVRR
jgi:hypothetical protein